MFAVHDRMHGVRAPQQSSLQLNRQRSPLKQRCMATQQRYSSLPVDEAEDAGPAIPTPPVGMDSGAGWGTVPNIHWRSLSREKLRRHPRYIALPAVDELLSSTWFGPAPWTWGMIRQEDPLWWSLHAGRLTASCLQGATGLRERDAARRLDLPRAASSRAHACDAAARLAQPVLVLSRHDEAASSEQKSQHALLAAAMADVVAFNNRLAAEPPEAPPDDVTSIAMRFAAQPPLGSGTKKGRGPKRGRSGQSQVAMTPEHRASQSAAARGVGAVRCAWGTAQESGTLFALLAAFPEAILLEVGLCTPCVSFAPPITQQPAHKHTLPVSWHDMLGVPHDMLAALPPMGASPDALIAWPLNSQYAPTCIDASNPLPPPLHAGAFLVGVPLEGVVLECVEVKNACPFREGRASINSGEHRYVLSDRGPPTTCPPGHVPQLQMQMLCTGASSALLACESATQGMALFRVFRDDAYLADMLHLIAAFTAMRGAFPRYPAQLFGHPHPQAARHEAFVQRTRSIAAAAQLVDFVTMPSRPAGNSRPFL